MRRDYFTVVFLACVAGALAFIWANPIYFTYGEIIPRSFSLMEIILSAFYAVFFLIIIPIVTSYYRRTWVCVGLAFYGILAYLPIIFLPRLEAAEDADSLVTIGATYLFRGMYDLVNAPFAGISEIIGANVASKLSCWILPVAVLVPLLVKYARFCRQAYITEKLAPSSADKPQFQAREVKFEPEVIGTVISAPAKPKSPEEVERKAKNDPRIRARADRARNLVSHDRPIQMPEGNKVRKVNIDAPSGMPKENIEAPQGTPPEKVAAPESASNPALGAGDVIQLGPGDNGVINLGPPPSSGN